MSQHPRNGARAARRTVLRTVCLALCAALAAPTARAQRTGTVTGVVVSRPGGSPIAGARVAVEGSTHSATTDPAGRYRLAGVGAGDRYLLATARGRAPGRAAARVHPGATVTVDFHLAAGSALLPGLVVSAARRAQPPDEVTATVNVLGRSAVRTSPARTADDLVRELPGVELPRMSSTVSGPEEIVSIRGADEGRTLVLLDDVPLNDPWGEWIEWNRAPRGQLDRVEVLEGGGSSLYGNYAMGGVISLFSRPITTRGYDVTASVGSRGATDLSLYGSGVRGVLGYAVAADYGAGGGYTVLRPDQRGPVDQRSEAARRNATARAEYALPRGGRLLATANLFSDDRALGTPLTQPNRRRIAGATLGADLRGIAGGRLELRTFGQSQHYASRASRVNAARTRETPLVAQIIPSRDLGGSAIWTRSGGRIEQLSIGADVRRMAGRLDEAVYDTAGRFQGRRSAGGVQLVGGVFVQTVLAPTAPLRIEASARADAWRSSDGSRADATGPTPIDTAYSARRDAAFAPRLGARYALGRRFTIRASYYGAFRAPTLSEQYRTFYSGPNTFQGNPALTPEHLSGADAGFDWRPMGALELRATAFRNAYRTLDDFTVVAHGGPGGGVILRRENVGRARSTGVESEIALRPTAALTLAGSFNYDDARVTATGAPVNRVPLQRAQGRITYADPRLAMVNAVVRYEGVSHALGGARLAPFGVLDLDVRREVVRGGTVFAAVENAFDRAYTVNVAGPLQSLGLPRTIRAGVELRSLP